MSRNERTAWLLGVCLGLALVVLGASLGLVTRLHDTLERAEQREPRGVTATW